MFEQYTILSVTDLKMVMDSPITYRNIKYKNVNTLLVLNCIDGAKFEAFARRNVGEYTISDMINHTIEIEKPKKLPTFAEYSKNCKNVQDVFTGETTYNSLVDCLLVNDISLEELYSKFKESKRGINLNDLLAMFITISEEQSEVAKAEVKVEEKPSTSSRVDKFVKSLEKVQEKPKEVVPNKSDVIPSIGDLLNLAKAESNIFDSSNKVEKFVKEPPKGNQISLFNSAPNIENSTEEKTKAKITIFGMDFESKTKACKHFKLDYVYVLGYMKENKCSFESAITQLKSKESKGKKAVNKLIEYYKAETVGVDVEINIRQIFA